MELKMELKMVVNLWKDIIIINTTTTSSKRKPGSILPNLKQPFSYLLAVLGKVFPYRAL